MSESKNVRREIERSPVGRDFIRRAMLGVSVLAISMVMQSNAASADGGKGGGSGGGAGGTLENSQGEDAAGGTDGGGGGGGPGGGVGGSGDGAGGAGGTGGAHGFEGSALPGGPVTGGDGDWGTAASASNGGGGGGGAGGYGAVVTGAGDATVVGGQSFEGGAGGNAAGWGGSGGDGGLGLLFSGGELETAGTLQGGVGGDGQGGTNPAGNGGAGGGGLVYTGTILTNTGSILGGMGARGGTSSGVGGNGGAGGTAVVFTGDNIVNSGIITGGRGEQGAAAGTAGNGGDGGHGVVMLSGGTLENTASGEISGANAGQGGAGTGISGGFGGTGGDGVRADNATIINRGIITGGRYGNDGAGGGNNWGANGYAIRGSDLTVINSGSLLYSGTNGVNSLEFTSGTNSLTLEAGYVINGNVVANGGDDSLILGGDGSAVGQFQMGGVYTGFESFEKRGLSVWELIGSNSNTLTHIDVIEGELRNRNHNTLDIDVAAGATLSGGGTAGDVIIRDQAILAPGNSDLPAAVDNYNMSSLQLSPNSILNFDLGYPWPNASEKIVVANGLTLDGTLNVSANTGFGSVANNGVYTLIEYGNLVADNSLEIGSMPAGYTYEIGVGSVVANAVTLTVTSASGNQFWDGSDPTAAIDGGSGTWNGLNTNWTNAGGTSDEAWAGGFAVFAGTYGTVTVVDPQDFTGMQFLTDGYEIVAGTDGELVTDTAATNIRIDTGITAEIAAPISGTGGLVKQEEGTLILSGENSYSGDTTVSGGKVQLGTVTRQGSVVGEVFIETDGDFDIVNADTSGIAGIDVFESTVHFRNDTNAGTAIIVSTSGFIEFLDTSSAEDATITNNEWGDVSFRQSATAGNASITNNRWMNFYHSSTAGDATIINNAELDFFDNSTAGNATLINNAGGEINFARSSGALDDGQISAGSIEGAGAFYLGSNTLTVGANGEDTTVSGVISDCGPTGSECIVGTTGGSLVKSGIGELTLTGENTYTGLTTVAQGSLSLGDGGAGGSVAGDIFNDNNILIFNRSDDHTYAGTISGSGTISFIGTGTTTLTGDSGAFAGPVMVDAGNLHLGAGSSIGASQLTVGANGTLSGVGTVEGNVSLEGRLAPGNSTGTINVAGNVVFAAGSSYEVELLAPDQEDLISATGTATIDGGEVVVTKLSAEQSYQGGQRYRIIEADGGVVRNDDFTYANPFLFLSSEFDYGTDYVDIVLVGSGPGQDFTSVAETLNQRQSATGLNGLGQSGDALAVYNELLSLTDADEARTALDLASGEIYASGRHVTDRTFQLFSRMLLGQAKAGPGGGISGGQVYTAPLAYGPASPGAGPTVLDGATTGSYAERRVAQAWLAPIGAGGSFEADGNAGRLDWGIGGISAGYERPLDVATGNAWLGAAAGYLTSHGTVDTRLSSLDADNFNLGVYGGWAGGPWSVAGSLAYQASFVETQRRIMFGGLDRTAEANYWTHMIGFSAEVAYGVDIAPGTTLSPLAALDAGWSGHGGFSETGAGALNLAGASESWTRLDAGLGVALRHIVLTESGKVTMNGRVVWEHAFSDVVPSQELAFAGSPTAFTVHGPDAGRDRIRLGAGASYDAGGNATIRANYDLILSGDQAAHAASLALELRF